jgi:hypothetical protein
MQEEIWKPVVGYEDLFEISSHGRLKSIRNKIPKILSQTISKEGYYNHATKIGGRRGKAVLLRIHRLVAEAFLPYPTDEKILAELNSFYGIIPVNHKDGNKLNNHVDNLEWSTYADNTKHAYDNKLLVHSPRPSRMFDINDIRFIRTNYSAGNRVSGARALAKKYNTDKSTIMDIIHKNTYKEIL